MRWAPSPASTPRATSAPAAPTTPPSLRRPSSDAVRRRSLEGGSARPAHHLHLCLVRRRRARHPELCEPIRRPRPLGEPRPGMNQTTNNPVLSACLGTQSKGHRHQAEPLFDAIRPEGLCLFRHGLGQIEENRAAREPIYEEAGRGNFAENDRPMKIAPCESVNGLSTQ